MCSIAASWASLFMRWSECGCMFADAPKPVLDFRDEVAAALPRRTAAQLIDLCRLACSPRVSFETAETKTGERSGANRHALQKQCRSIGSAAALSPRLVAVDQGFDEIAQIPLVEGRGMVRDSGFEPLTPTVSTCLEPPEKPFSLVGNSI
jgi:hypothetical protein